MSVITEFLNRRQLIHAYWCSTYGTDHFDIVGFLDTDGNTKTWRQTQIWVFTLAINLINAVSVTKFSSENLL